MNISIKYSGDIAIITVDNSVLQGSVPMFKIKLENVILTGRNLIIINMLNAEYLSSIGLSAIIDTKKLAEKSGGTLVLCNVNHLLRNLLEITNLQKMLLVYDSIPDAENAIFKMREG